MNADMHESRVQSVLILTHLVPGVTAEALRRVLTVLKERGLSAVVTAGEVLKHEATLTASGVSWQEWQGDRNSAPAEGVDLCVVLGGDGTTLRALHVTKGRVPVAGINLGRVGFLSTIGVDTLEHDFIRVLEGRSEIHRLPALELTGEGEGWTGSVAFNDIYFGRLPHLNVCRLGYSLNGVDLYDIRCDGLVAATPVGSSAYNLSSGGPLLGLGLPGFVVSFVAPHALTGRSVVATHDDILRVTNTSVRDPVVLVIDGEQHGTLEPGRSARVSWTAAAGRLALLPQDGLYRNFRERFL